MAKLSNKFIAMMNCSNVAAWIQCADHAILIVTCAGAQESRTVFKQRRSIVHLTQRIWIFSSSGHEHKHLFLWMLYFFIFFNSCFFLLSISSPIYT